MTGAHHHYAGPADLRCLDAIHALLDTVWSDAPHLDASERARFTLIVAELVANVIEHGTAGSAQPPNLELTITTRDRTIHGTLTDNGAEPPPGAATDTTANAHPGDPGLHESGRGLHLIRAAANHLELTRQNGHNHWQFSVH